MEKILRNPLPSALTVLLVNALAALLLWSQSLEILRVVALLTSVASIIALIGLLAIIFLRDPSPALVVYFFVGILEVVAIAIAFLGNFFGMLAIVGVVLGAMIIVESRQWHIHKPTWLSQPATLPFLGVILTVLGLLGIRNFWF